MDNGKCIPGALLRNNYKIHITEQEDAKDIL
jgi:hypothetical protein